MKQLRALLHREWRDQRTLIFVSLTLCVLVLVLGKVLGGKRFSPELRAEILPVCLGLFTILLATETIAREAHDGVARTLGRLPVSRTLAWFAKVSFIALGSGGGYLVLLLLERTLRWSEHRASFPGSGMGPEHLILIAAVTAASFAAVCVLRRSIPAALVGLLLVASVPLIAYVLPPSHASQWVDVVLCSWTPSGLAVIGAVAFALASLGAFRVRRVDRFGVRRAASAVFGACILLVPVFANTARSAAWAFDIILFSPTAKIRFVVPSPDGRFFAVEVVQDWTPACDWIPRPESKRTASTLSRSEVWILDRTSGHWNEIDDRYRLIMEGWDAQGRLVTVSSAGAFGGGENVFELIDPVSGCVRSRSTDEQLACTTSWYQQIDVGQDTVLTWTAKHAQIRLPKGTCVRASNQPGVVFHEQDGFVVRHEVDPENITRLLALGVPPLGVTERFTFVLPSPDGRLLYVQSAHDDRRIIDACDGHLVRRFDMQDGWFRGWSETAGRLCIVWHSGETFSALNEDGSETPLPGFESDSHEFGPDRLLRYDEQRIECMKLDGSEREVLYQARP